MQTKDLERIDIDRLDSHLSLLSLLNFMKGGFQLPSVDCSFSYYLFTFQCFLSHLDFNTATS
jgi:hypothetical protein